MSCLALSGAKKAIGVYGFGSWVAFVAAASADIVREWKLLQQQSWRLSEEDLHLLRLAEAEIGCVGEGVLVLPPRWCLKCYIQDRNLSNMYRSHGGVHIEDSHWLLDKIRTSSVIGITAEFITMAVPKKHPQISTPKRKSTRLHHSLDPPYIYFFGDGLSSMLQPDGKYKLTIKQHLPVM